MEFLRPTQRIERSSSTVIRYIARIRYLAVRFAFYCSISLSLYLLLRPLSFRCLKCVLSLIGIDLYHQVCLDKMFVARKSMLRYSAKTGGSMVGGGQVLMSYDDNVG